ncbi:MAG: glycosyltransferase family 4 protein [Vicinamibacteria bacterium]
MDTPKDPDLLRLCLMARVAPIHFAGGMQRYLGSVARELAARGHRVTVLTASFSREGREITADGVRYVGVPETRPESYRGGFFEKAAAAFERLHAANPFHLVWSQSIAALGILGIVRRRFEVPIVATLHGVWLSETEFEPTVRRAMGRGERLRSLTRFPKILALSALIARFGARADRTIVPSEWSRRELLRVAPRLAPLTSRRAIEEKIRVIHHSISPEVFRPLDRNESKTRWGGRGPMLLCLGRLEFQKGVQVAIEAVARVRGPAPTLLVAGTGSYGASLQRLAARLAPGRVRFLGHVPDDEIASLYSAADLFVYPELAQPAFGLVAAEAMCCGTPVVGSDIGAIPEVVGEPGFLFPPGSADALRDRIESFLRSPAPDRSALAGRARKRFDPDRTVGETLAVFREAIQSRRKERNPLDRMDT